MSWKIAIDVAIVTGLITAAITAPVSDQVTRKLGVSDFEGGRGMAVVFIFIPAGLRTGVGRRMTFAESRNRPSNDDVAEGFSRIGPCFEFDGAIDASSNPIVISMRQPRNPARAGTRLVLAMEQPAMCMDGMEPLPGGAAGLCTSWELLDARWDEGESRVMADMRAPG